MKDEGDYMRDTLRLDHVIQISTGREADDAGDVTVSTLETNTVILRAILAKTLLIHAKHSCARHMNPSSCCARVEWQSVWPEWVACGFYLSRLEFAEHNDGTNETTLTGKLIQ